jgi:hypothetical protein
MSDKQTKETLSLWDAVSRTDPKFTKAFQKGGGFKGTATNATYLARKATEMFGPCGIGWGVKVLDENVLAGSGDDRVHRVHVELWFMWNGQRGSIEHFGQTMLAGKNSRGPYTDEEAPKKSLTDAMTKALSLLGFAADIHLGLYDDNKYVNELRAEFAEDEARPRNGNGAEPKPEKSAYQARKDGDWQKFLEDLHAQDGTTAGLLKWVASRYPRIETFTWRGEAIEEWRRTLVHALAAECHSAVELERWRNEAGATTDRLPLDWQLAASGALEDAIANFRVTA